MEKVSKKRKNKEKEKKKRGINKEKKGKKRNVKDIQPLKSKEKGKRDLTKNEKDVCGRLYFSGKHVWVKEEEDMVVLGISRNFLKEITEEIMEVRILEEGTKISSGTVFCSISLSDGEEVNLISPISGTIKTVNYKVVDSPEIIFESPYDKGWFVGLEIEDASEFDELMTYEEYERFIGGEESE